MLSTAIKFIDTFRQIKSSVLNPHNENRIVEELVAIDGLKSVIKEKQNTTNTRMIVVLYKLELSSLVYIITCT